MLFCTDTEQSIDGENRTVIHTFVVYKCDVYGWSSSSASIGDSCREYCVVFVSSYILHDVCHYLN